MSVQEKKPRLIVIGGGPGGYPAAFLAAQQGMDVTLIDREPNPGGVCLYRGCIPSKALLHVAKVMTEAREAHAWGIDFGEPKIDLEKLRAWKDKVVSKLTGGLGNMSRQRKVKMRQGVARLSGPQAVSVKLDDGRVESIEADYILVATGSRPTVVPGFDFDSPRVMNSARALAIADIPETMLVVGGGYIGLELGSVYQALGTKVTVVEMTTNLLSGVDRDLADVLYKRLEKTLSEILVSTKVVEMQVEKDGVCVTLSGLHVGQPKRKFDKVLVAVGHKPNSEDLGLENTRVEVDKKGFIKIDAQRRTAEPSIFAVGDVAGEPMLAHKATYEGKIAVEAMLGRPSAYDAPAIPAVVFTDPEIAWCGLTETQARNEMREVRVARFPWGASGRAATVERPDGMTKLILHPQDERILGVGIVGVGAGELIAEGVLAMEMGACADDLRLTIHPHPTLSETVMESAEVFFGQSPHYAPRKQS